MFVVFLILLTIIFIHNLHSPPSICLLKYCHTSLFGGGIFSKFTDYIIDECLRMFSIATLGEKRVFFYLNVPPV